MCAMGKKSRHEIKTILTDAATLLKINLQNDFQKAEIVGWQVLIHFHCCPSKTLCQIRSFLCLMANIIKITFETKLAYGMLLEMEVHKKYDLLQQTQQHEANKTDVFLKNTDEKGIFSETHKENLQNVFCGIQSHI